MTTPTSPAGPTPLLRVHDLHVRRGGADVIDGVSLSVAAGEIVAVIGPNGAGKTTLLSALMGVLPSRGQVEVAGETDAEAPPSSSPIARRVVQGVGLVPETRALFAAMSVEDNLHLGAFRFRREPRQRRETALDEVFTLFPRLAERRKQAASTLSGGERQMLAVGRALMGRPRLLMLDEPSLGLAPLIVRDLFAIVAGLRTRGVAILLVEQNARAALALADRACVLESGRITLAGNAAEVALAPRVEEVYLGRIADVRTLPEVE